MGADWEERAACRRPGADPAWWFSDLRRDKQRAHAWCESACPVREPCLEAAIDSGSTYGIWGGLSPHQREQHAGKPRSGQAAADAGIGPEPADALPKS